MLMAKYFRKEGIKHNVPPIFFLSPTLYQLNEPFHGANFLYAEPELKGDWKKMTTNHTECKDDLMASFSHFSFWLSSQLFIITDLQGSGFLLTDPAIHSIDEHLFRERTNRMQEGINEFFLY